MHTYVIGDIHGALRALQQLLERIAPQPADRLIFMGDYIDGWSESAQVITFLTALEKTQECIFLRGNHDTWCETWLGGGDADPVWLAHGGQSTVDSYYGISGEDRATHLHFYRRLRNYYEDEHRRLYIHAGFSSMHGPAKDRDPANFMWDRTLWETALALNPALAPESPLYPKRLKLFPAIYIGHTPTINYGHTLPMHAANVWNVDTGAAFSGKLSAMEVNTARVIQSDTVQQLYPFERGRNA